ncbi:MAG: helix-turn-helix domain-containing protein [Desulfuromonadaceae bacterium]
MTDSPSQRRSACPVSVSLELLGDRWTLLVLRDLIFLRKRHFRDFLESPERIATNILSSRLRNLEQAAIVTRRPDPDNARQVIYELTAKGLDLIPLLLELILWGSRYEPGTQAPPELVKRAREDRDGLIAELRAAFLAGGDG